MPLQGLEKATKEDLLRKVLGKQLSLKELREAAENIKRKKTVARAFLRYTGEESWESLQRRFPHHATEEKLAQFKDVPMKRHKVPQVSLNLSSTAVCFTVMFEGNKFRHKADRIAFAHFKLTNSLHFKSTDVDVRM